MKDYLPSTYGDRIADVYDSLFQDYDASTVETLTSLAGDGPVLELGVGTGRLALPLARRGLKVHGIDASLAMVEKLRSKPQGGDISVTFGDFSSARLDQKFQLIFVAFNTLFALQTQDEQVRCFQNVASMLRRGGAFVVEAFVPDPARFDRGQRVSVYRIDEDAVWLETSRHDAVAQVVDSHLVRMSPSETRFFPIRIRYAWPAELDLMARVAGLRLRHRWSGWNGEAFSSTSPSHVSAYEPVASISPSSEEL